MRGGVKVRCALVTVLAVVSVGSASSAELDASTLSSLTASPLRAGVGAEIILDGVRSGSPSEVLAALLEAQGLDARAHQVPSAASTGLPAPVDAIAAAAHVAEGLRRDALADLSSDDRAAVRNWLLEPVTQVPQHPGGAGALLEAQGLARHAAADEIAAKVDERALRDAALTVLTAIDRQTPALLTLPQTNLAPSLCGASGDMVFETSDCSIMVGGTDANIYPAGVDPMVLIDLGGDDTYTNGAARASGNVRVLVDVSGDDTYVGSVSSSTPGGPITHAAGQAAGVLGVAVLADLGGTDTYTLTAAATAPEPGPVAPTAQATGQGAAIAGAGVLVDAGGGDDDFAATATSTGGPALTLAQGQSTIGLGALLSLGEGTDNDTYVTGAGSTLHKVEESQNFARFSIGNAESVAHGATNLAGAGILADRAGDDVYESRAVGAAGRSIAQGGSVGGAGLLVDVTGNDTMTSEAIGDATLSLITTNPSVCWTATVVVNTSATSAIGQGGAFGGVAGLIDGLGDDTRELIASSRAEAIAEAYSNHDCTAFGGNTARATARTGSGDATGQGAALLGVGVLVDVDGSDANHMTVSAASVARAIAISPGPDVEEAVAEAGTALAEGQGFSAVGLSLDADLGGADHRTASASTFVSRTTSAGTIDSTSPGDVRVHGWANGGRAYMIDIGGDDTYLTDPAGVSAADDDTCWSNTPDARGIDVTLALPLPSGCP